MPGITAEAQVAKKCYKNQTAGWLGVVKLDHLGGQVGHSIEPYGTAYLSDEEAQLTARAPKDPKDNPFVEQEFSFYDESGKTVQAPMRPLVLVEDERYDPSKERFVPLAAEISPDHIESDAANAARRADTATALAGDSEREVPTAASTPTLAPSSTAAVPPSQVRPGAPPQHTAPEPEEDVRQSWVENPERTAEPQQGSLGGGDAVEGPTDLPPTAAATPPQQPAPAGFGAAPADPSGAPIADSTVGVAEEHAGVTPSGEETGASAVPAGQAPAGEYARFEEVGSPDAAQAEAS